MGRQMIHNAAIRAILAGRPVPEGSPPELVSAMRGLTGEALREAAAEYFDDHCLSCTAIRTKGLPILCVYHGGCLDGAAAAAGVKHAFPDATFVKGVYGVPLILPSTPHFILYVDFSPKREEVEGILSNGHELMVIDHHATAETTLKGLEGFEFVFCEQESGASLTWLTLFGSTPMLVEHVRDRDLWLWELQDTREITTALMLHPLDETILDTLLAGDSDALIAIGAAVCTQNELHIKRMANKPYRCASVQGMKVAFVIAPVLQSEVGSAVLANNPELDAAVLVADAEKVSIRSNNGSARKLAEMWGGGGHDNAAGAPMPKEIYLETFCN